MNYQLEQEQLATTYLELPEDYPALREIKNAEIIFRIWRYHSLSVCSSWLLYKLKEDFFVRRLEWDRTKDNLYFGTSEPTIYASEGDISQEQVEVIIKKLKSLSLQPFQTSDLTFIDGTMYGIEARFENLRFSPTKKFPIRFTWHCEPPDSWEQLKDWLNETSVFFDKLLPSSTAKITESKFR